MRKRCSCSVAVAATIFLTPLPAQYSLILDEKEPLYDTEIARQI